MRGSSRWGRARRAHSLPPRTCLYANGGQRDSERYAQYKAAWAHLTCFTARISLEKACQCPSSNRNLRTTTSWDRLEFGRGAVRISTDTPTIIYGVSVFSSVSPWKCWDNATAAVFRVFFQYHPRGKPTIDTWCPRAEKRNLVLKVLKLIKLKI
jgi:hypothetical protein